MKSAYELAMERLEKSAPAPKLSAAKKNQLAELDSIFAAKIAGRELTMKSEMAKAIGDPVKEQDLRDKWAMERCRLMEELEQKKETVRSAKD